jgi:hypothetical protein
MAERSRRKNGSSNWPGPDGSTTPTASLRPLRSRRAAWLGRWPMRSASASTRARVAAATSVKPPNARDTVVTESPRLRAIVERDTLVIVRNVLAGGGR